MTEDKPPPDQVTEQGDAAGVGHCNQKFLAAADERDNRRVHLIAGEHGALDDGPTKFRKPTGNIRRIAP